MKVQSTSKNDLNLSAAEKTAPKSAAAAEKTDIHALHSSLREKHQFLQTLEKQGFPVADLQTRTEQALQQIQEILQDVGAIA